MTWRSLGALTVMTFASACVSPLASLRQTRVVTVDDSKVTLRWGDEDAETHAQVAKAIERALPELNRWGGLAAPVTLSLLPSHDALETVTGRYGYGWLRAWGQYDAVLLQSPRTWPSRPRESDVTEWLVHELTHCLLFQRSATAATWETKKIPLWFREGMATNTARQGYRFASLEDLATWQIAHPELDVFTDGEALSRNAFDQVYGLSHHAVAFLLRRYGDEAVLGVMRAMREGDEFAAAFKRAVGITPDAFARELKNYLRLRGFRGFGLPVRPRPNEQ